MQVLRYNLILGWSHEHTLSSFHIARTSLVQSKTTSSSNLRMTECESEKSKAKKSSRWLNYLSNKFKRILIIVRDQTIWWFNGTDK